jgi:hypothetical protein
MSKSRDIADSAATINYIDGLTSDAQGQLDAKATLDGSPTFTGTVTATAFSGDGSGLTGVDSLPSQTGNAGEFLTTDGTSASWAEISASPTLEATASGALANGDMVIINANGTVSVVTQSLGPSVIGSPTVYNSSGTTRYNNIAYDSNAQKVVIAYRNDGNSNYGTAIVGTVSGTSITFGTPVVFNSATTNMASDSIVFDSSNNKVVIGFRDDGNSLYGTAIVGTVSGTSISFGSESIFLNAQAEDIAMAFDSNSNKVVIFYRYVGLSNTGYASVGTVSGTSISFGSRVEFNNGETLETTSVFDSSNNKVVIFYRDNGNSEYGTARVGTVSGTSISFGSEVVFNTGTSNMMSAAFDSNSNKIALAYNDEPDSYKGKCIIGTVSGTSISFGSPVVFESLNAYFYNAVTFDSVYNKIVVAWMQNNGGTYTSKVAVGTISGTSISFDTPVTFLSGYSQNATITYDSNSESAVIVYLDNSNSGYGTASVFQPVTASTNLTSENFIGVADAAYSDGATAKIQLVGSVDDAQSGLTAGQTYYVQGDNTLSETPANPSVIAGTAVSATKLIVKG